LNEGKHAKDTDNKSQQQKTMTSNQGIPAGKKATPTTEGETAAKNDDTTLMLDMPMRTGNIALRTVSVFLRNGDRKLKINTLLDDASTKRILMLMLLQN